ncbi:hypothetical protein [Actinoplanes sp. NPDC020271]|uniref:hypothetical protein n=1 Tax=Actinoplanes sp. NPDC020271 TaxID=3363896 RepID=UPI00378B83B3
MTHLIPPGSVRPSFDIFQAAADLRHELSCEIDGVTYPISPVAEGYLAISRHRTEHLSATAHALRAGRTVVVVHGDRADVLPFSETVEAHYSMTASPAIGRHLEFLVPKSFEKHRADLLQRRLETGVELGNCRRQVIHAVGIRADRPDVLLRDLWEMENSLGRPECLVMSEWARDVIWREADCAETSGFKVEAVQYDYTDFNQNIRRVDQVLRDLQRSGIERVGLLVEGNPDTLDVLDGLSLAHRQISVRPNLPIGLGVALELSPLFLDDPFGDGHAFFSGLPLRHGRSHDEFFSEVLRYLEAGITCVVVEMVVGELSLLISAMHASGRDQEMIMLSDMYSPSAAVRILPIGNPGFAVSGVDRGTLATVLITNKELLPDGVRPTSLPDGTRVIRISAGVHS